MGQSRETTELQWRFSLFFCWQWLPRLPPRQTPRLRLTLTSSTEDTEDMVLATEAMDMVSATDMEVMDTTTARGRPRLSPRLRLTLTSCMVDTTDMASATEATTEAMDITTARGRLTPLWSLPLSATPTLPTPMLPLPLFLPPSPSPTRPTPPPWRPTLLLPTLPSPLPSEATRLSPVT